MSAVDRILESNADLARTYLGRPLAGEPPRFVINRFAAVIDLARAVERRGGDPLEVLVLATASMSRELSAWMDREIRRRAVTVDPPDLAL